jgi:CheY-like chemotaxis protein
MPYNVLVIDDNKNVAGCLADMIRLLGHEVRIAFGPGIAMRRLREGAADVLFLDVNMPGVNGLEVCRYVRRDPTTADLPVVIVSGNAEKSDREAAFLAGADHYIVKPAMLEDLEEALQKVMAFDTDEDAAAKSKTRNAVLRSLSCSASRCHGAAS